MNRELSMFELQELLVCGRMLLNIINNNYEPSLDEKKRLLNYLELTKELEKESGLK